MKEWIKKHKNEIITGVIVTIIVSILHWIGDYIRQGLPIAGNAIFSALVNSLYSSAATHNAGSSSIILLLLVIGSLLGTLLLGLTKLWKMQVEQNKLEKLKKQIEQLEKTTEGEDEEAKEKKRKAIESLLHVTEPKKKKRKILPIVTIVLVLIYLLWACIALIYPAALWQNFDVITIQIKPYISDTEMDMLKSKWTLMRSKEDFDEINKYIYKIREENGLIR